MELSKEIATPTFSSQRVWLIAILIAVLHAAMSITATEDKSPTFDEPAHLTAGYSYWLTNDFRLNPVNGSLPMRWAALPLLFSRPSFASATGRGWQRAEDGLTGHEFFYEVGNDSDRILREGRMMIALLSAALCLLIYRCSREFFGVVGGLLSETLAAFDPTMLAHGALVTSDLTVTFFFTASLWSVLRMLQKITPGRLGVAALSLSGLFLAKFSGPLILPMIGIVCVLQIFSGQPITLQAGRFEKVMKKKWSKAYAISATGFFLAATALFAIWAAYSFRFSASNDPSFTQKGSAWHWDYLLAERGIPENVMGFARAHHLLPEAYLYGLAFVYKHQNFPAFLDGRWSVVGFRSFFPRVFLYKTPLPILCFLVLGLTAALARWHKFRRLSQRGWEIIRRDCLRLAPWWIFVLVFGACAVASSLNIGQRHILPIYPALFIACGAAAYFLSKNYRIIGTAVVAILLLWQIGESVAIRPNYLAYFNEIAGGPSDGYKHLADSSVDWGQDLPALKTWLDNHPAIVNGKPLYLAYFGTADPRSYEINARLLPENHSSGDRAFAPLTGGIYCISATTLQSVYAREIGQWCVPYEQYYQAAAAEIRRYYDTASDPTRRVAMIANDGALNWAKKIKDFERLRFERLCAYLRHQAPAAQIGYSVFVFELTDDEVNRALYGPPAELTRDVCVSGF